MPTPTKVRVDDLPVVLQFCRGERSLKEQAERVGISSTALRNLERGEGDPQLSTLSKVASFLERPVVVEP